MSRVVNPPWFADLFHNPPVEPLLASTLVGFETNKSDPRSEHISWLQSAVSDLINSRSGCWVDLIGHASMVGGASWNLELSRRRTQRVADAILGAVKNKDATIVHSFPRGTSDSGSRRADNSQRFRSVEVLVYGPEAPEPHPKIVTDQRATFRRTVLVVKKKHEPSEPGLNEGFTKLLWALTAIVTDTAKINKRIEEHPLEKGDPDFGDEQEKKTAEFVLDLRLIKVDVEVVISVLPPERYIGFYYEVFRIERKYTYIYGAGLPDQKVTINAKESVIRNRVDPPWVSQTTRTADQPHSYLNP